MEESFREFISTVHHNVSDIYIRNNDNIRELRFATWIKTHNVDDYNVVGIACFGHKDRTEFHITVKRKEITNNDLAERLKKLKERLVWGYTVDSDGYDALDRAIKKLSK